MERKRFHHRRAVLVARIDGEADGNDIFIPQVNTP